MVLAEEMSSGRTMPLTVSSRSSLLVFTSWLPWMSRLPLGSTPVTTAATVRVICSWRFTVPVPAEVVLPLWSIILVGS